MVTGFGSEEVKEDVVYGIGDLYLGSNLSPSQLRREGFEEKKVGGVFVAERTENGTTTYITLNEATCEFLDDVHVLTLGKREENVRRQHRKARSYLDSQTGKYGPLYERTDPDNPDERTDELMDTFSDEEVNKL